MNKRRYNEEQRTIRQMLKSKNFEDVHLACILLVRKGKIFTQNTIAPHTYHNAPYDRRAFLIITTTKEDFGIFIGNRDILIFTSFDIASHRKYGGRYEFEIVEP